jgi:NAD(P)-dependent dehydrogenase (short-subunit alcohol dehydrogenase family)
VRLPLIMPTIMRSALRSMASGKRPGLHILVNNAATLIATTRPGSFWETPLEAEEFINVGLRSHFVASYHAAPLLIASGGGLIVNTGHYGAVCYYTVRSEGTTLGG